MSAGGGEPTPAKRASDLRCHRLADARSHLDHLPGCLSATGALLNRRSQLIEAPPASHALTFLAERERAGKRAQLACQPVDVVIELGADLRSWACSRSWLATCLPPCQKPISLAPIRARIRSPGQRRRRPSIGSCGPSPVPVASTRGVASSQVGCGSRRERAQQQPLAVAPLHRRSPVWPVIVRSRSIQHASSSNSLSSSIERDLRAPAPDAGDEISLPPPRYRPSHEPLGRLRGKRNQLEPVMRTQAPRTDLTRPGGDSPKPWRPRSSGCHTGSGQIRRHTIPARGRAPPGTPAGSHPGTRSRTPRRRNTPASRTGAPRPVHPATGPSPAPIDLSLDPSVAEQRDEHLADLAHSRRFSCT